MAYKHHHLLTADGVRIALKKQFASRGDGPDDRPVIARERTAENGRLAAWGPGADDSWQQIQAGFIDEHDRPPFLPGFF